MQKMIPALLLSGLFLGGCAGLTNLFGEAKTDAAIIGMTGWWFKIGIDSLATPLGVPLPIPSITVGRGTIFRVGVTESATIRTGEAVKIKIGDLQDQGSSPEVMGDGSLIIETKDTSRALEKMRDIYSQRGPDKAREVK